MPEEISKKSAEGEACFVLAAYSKMQEETDKLKKEQLSKKKLALDDLEDSQPIQRECSGNSAKGVTGQPFTREIKCVAHGSIHHLSRSQE